jgi:hypothetical protein
MTIRPDRVHTHREPDRSWSWGSYPCGTKLRATAFPNLPEGDIGEMMLSSQSGQGTGLFLPDGLAVFSAMSRVQD